MAGDPDTGRGVCPSHGHGLRDGVRIPVAGRDRASLRRELADKLAAYPRATAGHHGELTREGSVLRHLTCSHLKMRLAMNPNTTPTGVHASAVLRGYTAPELAFAYRPADANSPPRRRKMIGEIWVIIPTYQTEKISEDYPYIADSARGGQATDKSAAVMRWCPESLISYISSRLAGWRELAVPRLRWC
jgi:hypothetical protein